MGVKIKKIISYILTLLITLSSVSATILINEIMYNPEGSDNNKEFIEIYSDEIINLSDFIIGDLHSNDTLTLLQYYDSDYYLITEEGFNLSGIEVSVYSAGITIGNNLNTEDSVFLYYNNTLIHNISYTDDCESGYSLEYSNGNLYCSFYNGGTPGKQNSERNQDYTKIKINEFFPNPSGNDNALMPNGEFIELYNNGDNDTDLAALYFKDSANHKIYITDTTTTGTIIESEDYLAVYMNGFSGFLNNEGFEEIKLYDPYGNLIHKINYASSEEALSWSLVGDIWQQRLPTPNEKNPSPQLNTESSFKINGIEDLNDNNETEFGNIIKVKFHAYKGNTTKSSIKFYIENDEDRITKITKARLYDKYTNYTLTLPIPIESNCNQKYADGDYYVKVGWTSSKQPEDTFKIKIDGINMDNCDKIYVERKPKKGTLKSSLMEAPATVELNKDFTLKIELTNNDGADHLVDLYSYVYKGSKSYSPGREANKKSVLVKAGQTKEFELKDIITGAEPGDYKIKIKAKRDDQKTEKEITQTIKVLGGNIESEITETEEKTQLKGNDQEDYTTTLESTKQPITIYESPGIRSKKLVIYFFIGLLTIYGSILTWKR